MKLTAQGLVVHEGELLISEAHLGDVARAIGTPSGTASAALVPYFGPTIAGETEFVELLGLDLSNALLGGLNYEWRRPFRAGEKVHVRVFIEQVYDRGNNRFGVVVAEFIDSAGVVVQLQSATFIEQGASA